MPSPAPGEWLSSGGSSGWCFSTQTSRWSHFLLRSRIPRPGSWSWCRFPPVPSLLLKADPSPGVFPPLQLLPDETTAAKGKQGHRVCLKEYKGISSFSFTHSNYFLDSLSLPGLHTSYSPPFLPGLRHLSLPRDNLSVQIPSNRDRGRCASGSLASLVPPKGLEKLGSKT